MEWVGITGCFILAIAFALRARQAYKARRRNEARYAAATVVYLCLFSWFLADYYSTKSILTAIVNAVPVEIGIALLITFHILLLAHSVKHPPFENRTNWSDARKGLFRQGLFFAEASLVCCYCYFGIVFRDVSLVLASESGNYAEVQRSLALGANPAGGTLDGVMDQTDNMALEGALDRNDFRIAKLLIDHGAPLDQPDQETHVTPLMYEISRHNKPGVMFLIAQGVNINLTTGDGLTALKIAHNDTDMARMLIEHGVFVNTASREGSTALFDYAGSGNVEGVKLLIDNGARVKGVMRSGFTPLMAAAKSGSAAVEQELISAGADIYKTDDSGRDALWYAAIGHHKAAERTIRQAMQHRPLKMQLHNGELNDTLSL